MLMLSCNSYLKKYLAARAMISEWRMELSHSLLARSRRVPRYRMLSPLSWRRSDSYLELVNEQSRFSRS